MSCLSVRALSLKAECHKPATLHTGLYNGLMPDASKPSMKSGEGGSKPDPLEQIETMLAILEDTFADLIAEPISQDMLDLLRALDSEPLKRRGRPWLRGRR
jgi:hypothetical protein